MDSPKRFLFSALERFVALIVLVLVLPLLLLAALLIRTTSDGRIINKDELVSRDGKLIHIHRFRTTGQGNAAFHVVGRFLRTYSIDELPGFWSVAHGDIELTAAWRKLCDHH